MNENQTLREQMWDLCYGLLSAEEVTALHKQIKSDPAAARLYAEVRLEADLVASAAKIEDASVSLSVPDEDRKVQPAAKSRENAGESPFKQDKPGRLEKHRRRTSYRIANWLATLAATALVGLIVYGIYAPPRRGVSAIPDTIVASVYARQPLQSGLTQNVKVVARNGRGEPAITDVTYQVSFNGNVLQQDVVHTNEFGEAELSLSGSAVRPGAVLELQAQSGQQSGITQEYFQHKFYDQVNGAVPAPKLVVSLAAQPEPVISDVRWEHDSYQPGETLRFWVHSRRAFSNEPVLNADEWKLVAADGTPISPTAIEPWREAGVVSGTFELPANGPQGEYTLRAVNRRTGAEEDLEHVSVGLAAEQSGDLVRRSRLAGFDRSFRALGHRELLAEMDKANIASKVAEKQENRKLSMPKEKNEVAAAATPGAGSGPPAPAPAAAPAPPKAAKQPAPPGGTQLSATPMREKEQLKNALSGTISKSEATDEKKDSVESKLADPRSAYERAEDAKKETEVSKKEGADPNSDELVLEIPAEFAQMKLLAVVKKSNVIVAMQQYAGRTLEDGKEGDREKDDKAKELKELEKAVENTPYSEGTNGRDAAPAKSFSESKLRGEPATNGKLHVPLPPEADGELGITLFDQTVQPPRPVLEQRVRRASSRGLKVDVESETASFGPEQDLRLKLSVKDHNGEAVPHSLLSVQVVKASDVLANLATVEEAAPLFSRAVADKAQEGLPARGGGMALGGPAGFGGGGGISNRPQAPKDGDAKSEKMNVPATPEKAKPENLTQKEKKSEVKTKEAHDGKPAEVPAEPAPPAPKSLAPAGRGGGEKDSGFAEAPRGFSKQLPEDRAEKSPLPMPGEVAQSLSYRETASLPVIPQEILLASNDSLIQDAAAAEVAQHDAARAGFQRMVGRAVLIGAVGSLLLLGLLAVLHRPAQAKVLVPAMIIVVGGFGIGSFWLVNGNRAGREIANHLDNPVETAPMPAAIESIRPMAPRSMPAAMDDLRTEKFKEDGLPNAGAIGPTVELSPPAKSEEKPQSGSGKSEDRESPPAPSKPDAVPDAEPKPKAATDPGEKPAPANLRSDEDKKKIDENRQNSDKGKGTAKDALLKKSAPEPAADRPAGALPEKPAEKPAASILEAGKKPLVMQSAQGDAQRAAKGIPQPATKGAPQPAAENTAQPAAENNLQRDKRTKKSGLLWAPNLPANEKGEAELNLQLPAEEGDYFLLVDVQGPGGVGTIQKVIPVRRAPAGPAAPATPATPAKP